MALKLKPVFELCQRWPVPTPNGPASRSNSESQQTEHLKAWQPFKLEPVQVTTEYAGRFSEICGPATANVTVAQTLSPAQPGIRSIRRRQLEVRVIEGARPGQSRT